MLYQLSYAGRSCSQDTVIFLQGKERIFRNLSKPCKRANKTLEFQFQPTYTCSDQKRSLGLI